MKENTNKTRKAKTMKQMKVIYWDMDGTIADLYAVEGWLTGIDSRQVFPYVEAEPMWDMVRLASILGQLREMGYVIGVITWLSKSGTKEYNNAVRKAKREWLERYGLWELMDEVHMVKYGTPKHITANIRHGILVDDNKSVREAWENYGGETIDPTEVDVLEALMKMMEE